MILSVDAEEGAEKLWKELSHCLEANDYVGQNAIAEKQQKTLDVNESSARAKVELQRGQH